VTNRCIAVLGGSFDPVHAGHVALAQHAVELLDAGALRVIPAGNPWQKRGLHASAAHRVAMLRLAFAHCATPLLIDEQEIHREAPTYSIDTLQMLRAELGSMASVVLVIGADQLHGLHTWRQWRSLFDLAHVLAISRPGFGMNDARIDPAVAEEFARRAADPQQMHAAPGGLTALSASLDIDISSSEVRRRLSQRQPLDRLLPDAVLDYIQQNSLYQD
jgi:nicotinate-nucleotide adenylyltransferase